MTTKPKLSELLDSDFYDMVRSLANTKVGRYPNNPMITTHDLESEGMLAALRAYELFDPDRKVMFRTYAFTFVTRAMDHYCLKNCFRLSASSKDLHKKFSQVHEANSGIVSIDEVDIAYETAPQLDADLEGFFFADLDDRQKGLARDRFINDMSMQALADKYNLSISGIDQALCKVKTILQRRGRIYESNNL